MTTIPWMSREILKQSAIGRTLPYTGIYIWYVKTSRNKFNLQKTHTITGYSKTMYYELVIKVPHEHMIKVPHG